MREGVSRADSAVRGRRGRRRGRAEPSRQVVGSFTEQATVAVPLPLRLLLRLGEDDLVLVRVLARLGPRSRGASRAVTAKPIATQAIIASPRGEMSHIAPSISSIYFIAVSLDVSVLVATHGGSRPCAARRQHQRHRLAAVDGQPRHQRSCLSISSRSAASRPTRELLPRVSPAAGAPRSPPLALRASMALRAWLIRLLSRSLIAGCAGVAGGRGARSSRHRRRRRSCSPGAGLARAPRSAGSAGACSAGVRRASPPAGAALRGERRGGLPRSAGQPVIESRSNPRLPAWTRRSRQRQWRSMGTALAPCARSLQRPAEQGARPRPGAE